ncbi:MAG: helicase-related protein [Pseudomonadota bacterium]
MRTGAQSRVTAMLGPTNTGKTHFAIERMLGHRTGIIGLPLRLLAREVFDRIVALRGPSVVALVTGEERIVPPRATFWVCTVEAMPLDLAADFLAVDEIQLCGDPERGHVFTDRLLNARGLLETLFLGSDTIRPLVKHLIPGVDVQRRERFSRLSYSGPRKISRMPPRSAIVGFSVDEVYSIAELIRRQKGGAAVVMGALSPRTRNAQVALYQNGDVDHLVATDAIGMGLNLDIEHVAFSGVVKFDGRKHRQLLPNELAQIAGRAGRYRMDGTFGVTNEVTPLEPGVIDAIEASRFAPLKRLQWRNGDLEFGNVGALLASIEAPSPQPELVRTREADDLATLKFLSDTREVTERINSPSDVALLWDICRLPDFRKVSISEHAALCIRLLSFLQSRGHIPPDWLAGQIARIDNPQGDIDTLSKRLAYIRTWTYVAQRRGWVEDSDHWRNETRAVEDRLSDALHERLTQRFVDRRTSVLMRRLKQRETLVAQVTESGEVSIDEQFIGRLEGFRFRLDPNADPDQVPTLRAAAIAALAPVFSLRSDKFYNAPDTEFDVTEQGGLMWGEHAVGKLVAGADPLSPQVHPFVDEDAAPDVAEKVKRRLGHFIDRRIAALFEPLIKLRDDEALSGIARGIAFRLVEALGVVPRSEVAHDVKALEQDQRAGLRKHGVRFGQFTIFMPLLLKPAPTRLRLVLCSLFEGLDVFPEAPPPGLVTVPAMQDAPKGYYARSGYRPAGERAIRIDMLERLADMVRPLDAREGFEASPDMLSISGLSLEQFAKLMQGLGYQATQGTRPKKRPATPDAVSPNAGEPQEQQDQPAPPAGGAPPSEDSASAARDAEVETPQNADAHLPASSAPQVENAGPEGAAEGPEGASNDALLPESTATAPSTDRAVEAAAEQPDAEAISTDAEATPSDTLAEQGAVADASVALEAADEAEKVVETETFFVFTRAPRRKQDRPVRQANHAGKTGKAQRKTASAEREGSSGEPQAGKPNGARRGRGHVGKGKPKSKGNAGAVQHSTARERAPRKEKTLDPDNPFAALAALKFKN